MPGMLAFLEEVNLDIAEKLVSPLERESVRECVCVCAFLPSTRSIATLLISYPGHDLPPLHLASSACSALPFTLLQSKSDDREVLKQIGWPFAR
jgi:hypothetical protein